MDLQGTAGITFIVQGLCHFPQSEFAATTLLGACLRGRTATQCAKKGSEKVLERVLGKGSQKRSEKGVCYGFYSRKGF